MVDGIAVVYDDEVPANPHTDGSWRFWRAEAARENQRSAYLRQAYDDQAKRIETLTAELADSRMQFALAHDRHMRAEQTILQWEQTHVRTRGDACRNGNRVPCGTCLHCLRAEIERLRALSNSVPPPPPAVVAAGHARRLTLKEPPP